MSILSGSAIRKAVESGDITLDPYVPDNIQPNSIDVRLGHEVRVFSAFVASPTVRVDFRGRESEIKYSNSALLSSGLFADVPRWDTSSHYEYPCLDSKKENPTTLHLMDESGWIIKPGILYLMHCVEAVHTNKYRAEIVGKSSIARLGITIHCTAAHAETGFSGQFTLESHGVHPVKLYPYMFIGQITFETVEGEVEDYKQKGHYVGEAARGAVPSRSYMQFIK